MKTDYCDVDWPDYAICWLVYGDKSGMNDDDIQAADAFRRQMQKDGYTSPVVLDDHNEFCRYPAFGLACATTKVRFIKKPKMKKRSNLTLLREDEICALLAEVYDLYYLMKTWCCSSPVEGYPCAYTKLTDKPDKCKDCPFNTVRSVAVKADTLLHTLGRNSDGRRYDEYSKCKKAKN